MQIHIITWIILVRSGSDVFMSKSKSLWSYVRVWMQFYSETWGDEVKNIINNKKKKNNN